MIDNTKLFNDFKHIIDEKNLDTKLDEQSFEAYLNHGKVI